MIPTTDSQVGICPLHTQLRMDTLLVTVPRLMFATNYSRVLLSDNQIALPLSVSPEIGPVDYQYDTVQRAYLYYVLIIKIRVVVKMMQSR